jgi:predicted AAA+ superfamily ATPase
MPHSRPRYAETLIQRALTHTPIVGVFGQRQVGKTTLVEKSALEYRTLDDESTLLELDADPTLFLQNRKKTFAIDEAQLSPRIFPALKEFVRVHKRPGQFILSGSVRFTSRKAIRESLTGRISTVEILPFSWAEAHQMALPNLLARLSKVSDQKQLEKAFASSPTPKRSHFEEYLQTGGLPGIAFFRSPEIRADRWQSQIDTLLNRDLRLIQNTTLPYAALRSLLEFLALHQGSPFELQEAVKATQISAVTIRRLLFAYEALFLIRLVQCTGDQKKPTYFLEDQGFASWIARSGLDRPQDIVRGLYANLRQELHYRPELNGRIYQYRTKHAVEIPLVLDATGVKVGLLASLERELRPKTLASAQAFLKKHPGFKCVIAYGGSDAITRSENLFMIPFWWFFG